MAISFKPWFFYLVSTNGSTDTTTGNNTTLCTDDAVTLPKNSTFESHMKNIWAEIVQEIVTLPSM